MDRYMNGIGRWMDRLIDRLIYRWMDVQIYEWIDMKIEGQMCVDIWMKWIVGWLNSQMHIQIDKQ